MSTTALFVQVTPSKHKIFSLTFSEHSNIPNGMAFYVKPLLPSFFCKGKLREFDECVRHEAMKRHEITSIASESKRTMSRLLLLSMKQCEQSDT